MCCVCHLSISNTPEVSLPFCWRGELDGREIGSTAVAVMYISPSRVYIYMLLDRYDISSRSAVSFSHRNLDSLFFLLLLAFWPFGEKNERYKDIELHKALLPEQLMKMSFFLFFFPSFSFSRRYFVCFLYPSIHPGPQRERERLMLC